MTANQADRIKAELEKIDKSIGRANKAVIAWMGAWAIFYFGWFFYKRGAVPPITAANWGVMGDFFGGFLNPVVAYFAFFWLTKSVRLQKEELAESRQALSDSAAAQNEQARLAHANVRLNALSALTNSIMSEVATQRLLLQFYVEQMKPGMFPRDIEGNGIDIDKLKDLLAQINSRISDRMAERLDYEEKIRALLKAHSPAAP